MSIKRVIDVRTSPDLSPITSPMKGDAQPSYFYDKIAALLSDLRWKLDLDCWSEPHLSSKVGPNGLATMSALTDLKHLPEDLVSDLKLLSNSEDFGDYIDELRETPLDNLQSFIFKFKPKDFGRIRKLAKLDHPEGKCRIIAIPDYWTQAALNPLHTALFELLREIKGDCTYSQHNTSALKEGPYYSIDLKNATDRFPI